MELYRSELLIASSNSCATPMPGGSAWRLSEESRVTVGRRVLRCKITPTPWTTTLQPRTGILPWEMAPENKSGNQSASDIWCTGTTCTYKDFASRGFLAPSISDSSASELEQDNQISITLQCRCSSIT